jgi:hypothetical protein
LSEQSAWDFFTTQKPVFELTVLNPNVIIGPMVQPVHAPKAINESNLFAVYDFFNGKYTDTEHITFPDYYFVCSLIPKYSYLIAYRGDRWTYVMLH